MLDSGLAESPAVNGSLRNESGPLASNSHISKVSGNDGMKLEDWRWAAEKGPKTRCWNEDLGGMKPYISHKNERRADTMHRQLRGSSKRARFGSSCLGISLQHESPRNDIPHLAQARGAASTPLNAGYQAEPLMAIIDELPPALRDAISVAIDAARLYADCGARHAATATPPDTPSMDPVPSAGDDAPLSAEWERDAEHAIVELRFDPATQARVGGAANARAAALLGMRHDALLARLARGEAAPLPLPPPDAVAVFLHALGATADAMSTSYFRICPPAAPDQNPMPDELEEEVVLPLQATDAVGAALVCCMCTKEYDAHGRVRKSTAMLRVVSAAEYDAAARFQPLLCPLIAAGDARPGRRLLADADADAARTIADALGGGSEFLSGHESDGGSGAAERRLVRAAAAVAKRLLVVVGWIPAAGAAGLAGDMADGHAEPGSIAAGAPPSVRPCLTGRPCRRPRRSPADPLAPAAPRSRHPAAAAAAAAAAARGAEGGVSLRPCRPVGGRGALVLCDPDEAGGGGMPFPTFTSRRQWAGPLLRRFWTHGFQVPVLSRIIDAMPPRLEAALAALLSSICAALARPAEPAHPRDPPDFVLSGTANEVAEMEAEMWEAEAGCSFMRFDYDPDTQRRRRVVMNRSVSVIHGKHGEEILARFAWHEAELPFSEADSLRYLVFELVSSQRDVQRFFYRSNLPNGRAHLLCRTSLRIFDSAGRISTMKHITKVVTPDEYDEAVCCDPLASTLAATGDFRTGRQLLADAAADRRRSIAAMAACPRGRAELNTLAAAVEVLAYGPGGGSPSAPS